MPSNVPLPGKRTNKPFGEWKLPENCRVVSNLSGRTVSIIGNVRPASASEEGSDPDNNPPMPSTPTKPETHPASGQRVADQEQPDQQPQPKAPNMVEPENEDDETPEERAKRKPKRGGSARKSEEVAAGHAELVGLPAKPIQVGDKWPVPGPLKAHEAAENHMKSAGSIYNPSKQYLKADK